MSNFDLEKNRKETEEFIQILREYGSRSGESISNVKFDEDLLKCIFLDNTDTQKKKMSNSTHATYATRSNFFS